MKESEDSRSGAAKAVHRVSQVTTVGLMLALPILAGHYADQYFGTSPWLTILLLINNKPTSINNKPTSINHNV